MGHLEPAEEDVDVPPPGGRGVQNLKFTGLTQNLGQL
jgi:hypothetical protein